MSEDKAVWKHIENVLELQCNVGATLFENGLKTPGHLLQCHPCEMMELHDKMRLKDWDRLQLDNFIGFMEWYSSSYGGTYAQRPA